LAIITFRNLSEFGAEWSVFSVDIPSQLGSWTQPITDSLMPLLEAPVEAPLHVWNFLSQTGPSVIYDIITHPFTFSLDIDAYYSLFDALVYPVLIVFATEVLVDWIKHAFISKFNHIRPSVYSKYLSVLCKDYVLGPCKTMPTFKEGETLPILMNNSMHVARRIGFAAMPLACLLVRILLQMIASTGWAKCDDDSPFILHCSYSYVMTFIVIMPVLFIVKCFLSIGLARFSLDRYRSSIITSKNPVDQSAALIMPSTLRMMRPPAFSAGSAQRRMPSYWDLDDVPHISRLYSIPTSPDVSTSLLHTGGNYSAPVVSSSQSTINQAENEPTNNAATIAIISAHTDSPTTPSSSGTPTPILESIDRFTMLKGRIP
jgi:hypothetical protein